MRMLTTRMPTTRMPTKRLLTIQLMKKNLSLSLDKEELVWNSTTHPPETLLKPIANKLKL